MFFSPIKTNKIVRTSKISNRPFSSVPSRSSFQSNIFNINNPMTDKRSIKYIVENNLYDSFSLRSTRMSNTRNNYNKLKNCNLRGKYRFSNFTVFIRREMSQREKKVTPQKVIKILNRQKSAVQLNPNKIFREGILFLTDIITKKTRKPTPKNVRNYALYRNRNNNDFMTKLYQKEISATNKESQILNNYKYQNINLLRRIESDKTFKKKPCNFEEEKNNYLFNKKLEYISMNQKDNKSVKKYMENLNDSIKNQYTQKLKREKIKINFEEIKNENQYIDDKISSVHNWNNLYEDLFLNKFNDYMKFLIKKIDEYDKSNYLLLNDVFILQKQINKLKMRINKLLDLKRMYNKFIILQISLKQKTMKLPEHYDYILSHTLEEGIENYKGILNEQEVKEIYRYKKKIIYKNFETFIYQFKTYENENRDLLTKLGTMKREISKLNDNKNEVIEEGKRLTNYFNNRIKEKSKEKIEIMNKYYLLIKEKNNLLSEIKLNFMNVNNLKKDAKKRFNFIQDYNSIIETTNKSSNNHTNISYYLNKEYKSTNTKKAIKTTRINNHNSGISNPNNSAKNVLKSPKSHNADELIFNNFHISYESKDKKAPHSKLYLKIRKLYILLKNFIKIDEHKKKEEKIYTENGLIIKILAKIEEGLNIFLEKKKDFYEKNKEVILQMKQKIEKERKRMKGQRYISMLKKKNEKMKIKVEEKAKRIYFLPKNKKRNVSANINKKKKNKKVRKVIEKSEYELLLDYFKEN